MIFIVRLDYLFFFFFLISLFSYLLKVDKNKIVPNVRTYVIHLLGTYVTILCN